MLVTALVFWRVHELPFLQFDDPMHITNNPYYQPISPARIWFFWRYPFDPTPAPGIPSAAGGMAPPYEQIYAPLAFTAWGLLTLVARETTLTAPAPGTSAPLDPSIYHAFNLALHIINVLLLFALLRRLVKNDAGALAGALLFAVHPTQVEAVAWVTGMNNLLAAFFAFAALHFYLSHLDAEARTRDGRGASLRFLAGATLLFALALLSKPSSAPVPAIALLLAWWRGETRWKRRVLELVPWMLLVGATTFINRRLQVPELGSAVVTPYLRPFLIGDAFAFYGAKLLWPLQLAPDYGRKPGWIVSHWWGYVTWLAPAAMAFFVALKWRARAGTERVFWRRIGAGGAIFAFTLLPMSGIVTYYFHLISTVADRYLYFANFGTALVVALAVTALLERAPQANASQKRRQGAIIIAAMTVLGAAWGVISARQIGFWSSDHRLWARTMTVNPRSVAAYSIMGGESFKRHDYARSLRLFDQALALEPDNWKVWDLVGVARKGAGDRLGARRAFAEALRVFPLNFMARHELAKMDLEDHNLLGAIKQLGEALKIRPDDAVILGNFGVTAGKLGNAPLARQYLEQALQKGFDPATGHFYLGIAFAVEGKMDEALAQWNQSLLLDPNSYKTHYNVGLALLKKQRYNDAIASLRRCVQLEPRYAPAYLDWGLALEKQGQKAPARLKFQKALKLDPSLKTAQAALKRLAS